MPIKPFLVQKRMAELGRVRLGGEKSNGQVGKKLAAFRFTSASKEILESVAAEYGGKVVPWEGAEDEGYFQIYTEAAELPVVFPPIFSDVDGTPTVPFSQWMELWSGGGCQRRCDGETEAISGGACLCDPDNRTCKPTTRISFLLPDVRGLGTWRIESTGWNVAAEAPGMVSLLMRSAVEGTFIPATIRLVHKTSKKDGVTRKFVVPVIEIAGISLNELAGGELPLAVNGPKPAPPRAELPAATVEPAAEPFERVEPALPQTTPPPLPNEEPPPNPNPEGPPPQPDPDAQPEPETNGATPLTKSELDLLIEASEITKEQIGEAGRSLYPGKSFSKLTNAERGELWVVLQGQEVAV